MCLVCKYIYLCLSSWDARRPLLEIGWTSPIEWNRPPSINFLRPLKSSRSICGGRCTPRYLARGRLSRTMPMQLGASYWVIFVADSPFGWCVEDMQQDPCGCLPRWPQPLGLVPPLGPWGELTHFRYTPRFFITSGIPGFNGRYWQVSSIS